MKFNLLGFSVDISKASPSQSVNVGKAPPGHKELEPEINKPVREFVDTFLARPKTFACNRIFTSYRDPVIFELFDTSTSTLFKSTILYTGMHGGIDMFVEVNGKSIDLTEDEKAFARYGIGKYYIDRAKKLRELRQLRIRRDLTRIYA